MACASVYMSSFYISLLVPAIFKNCAGIAEANSAVYGFSENRVMSPLCKNQTQELDKAIKEKKEWALRIRDSNGRPGPGVLLHRLWWLGSYDQCLTTEAPPSLPIVHPVHPRWLGHYCLASITLQQFESESTKVGLCFPEGCNDTDVQLYLEENIDRVLSGLQELQLKVQSVDHVTCQVRHVRWGSATVSVIVLLCLLTAVIGFSTVCHVFVMSKAPRKEEFNGPRDLANLLRDKSSSSSNVTESSMLLKRPVPRQPKTSRMQQIMTCFSLKSGLERLTDSGQRPCTAQGQRHCNGQGEGGESPEVLSCLHGLRVLSMLWVIQGHTHYFLTKVPTGNLKEAWDKLKKDFLFQAVLNSSLAADTFFLISGILASYLSLRYMASEGSRRNLLHLYCRRLWRVTPVYMLVIVLVIFVVPHVSSGPLWPELARYNQHCHTHWWTNLLYINNLVHADQMCLEWTWYVSSDTQFYLLTPFFVSALHWCPAVGLFLCGLVVVVTSALTGFIATFFHLGLSPWHLDQFSSSSYMENYYVKPYCRAPPYFIGIMTGYILHRTRCELELSHVVKIPTTLVVTISCMSLLFGTMGVANGADISQPAASFYIAVSHVIWAVGVAWVVLMCCTNNGGVVSAVLSWEGLVPLSRLSLCVYLMHPIVILVHYYSARTPFYITRFTLSFTVIGNTVFSFASALVLYLGLQSPLTALGQLLWKR